MNIELDFGLCLTFFVIKEKGLNSDGEFFWFRCKRIPHVNPFHCWAWIRHSYVKTNITLLLVMVGYEVIKSAIDLDQTMALSKHFDTV